jgi:translation initiation factor 1A
MVKNTKGGNKAKKQARKSGNTELSTAKTRLSTDTDEVYACCSKLLGNGMCQMLCIDGIERLCIIRSKFRGRGRRGNIVSVGTWCLIGRRAFEKPKPGKLEKTDLLEVYNENEKKIIIQKEVTLKKQWKIFNNLGCVFGETQGDDDINFQSYTEAPEESADDNGDAYHSGDANDSNGSNDDDDDDDGVPEENSPSSPSPSSTTVNYTGNFGDNIDIDDI